MPLSPTMLKAHKILRQEAKCWHTRRFYRLGVLRAVNQKILRSMVRQGLVLIREDYYTLDRRALGASVEKATWLK